MLIKIFCITSFKTENDSTVKFLINRNRLYLPYFPNFALSPQNIYLWPKECFVLDLFWSNSVGMCPNITEVIDETWSNIISSLIDRDGFHIHSHEGVPIYHNTWHACSSSPILLSAYILSRASRLFTWMCTF